MLAARDRQRAGQSRGGSRNSSASRELMRSDPGAPLQVQKPSMSSASLTEDEPRVVSWALPEK